MMILKHSSETRDAAPLVGATSSAGRSSTAVPPADARVVSGARARSGLRDGGAHVEWVCLLVVRRGRGSSGFRQRTGLEDLERPVEFCLVHGDRALCRAGRTGQG